MLERTDHRRAYYPKATPKSNLTSFAAQELCASLTKHFCHFLNEAYGGTEAMQSITATELKARLDNGEDVQIVDVREANEVAIGRIPNSIHIPLAQVLERMSEIDPSRDTVVHCKMGGRSARAIEALQRSGYTGSLSNLTGGIIAWSNDVDPSVPKY